MADILDSGLCLVRIPKGILGDETSRLLGSFVVAKVWQAATARARLGQHARVDASLYVDECQNFLTLPRSFDEMLAEARVVTGCRSCCPSASGPAAPRAEPGRLGQRRTSCTSRSA